MIRANAFVLKGAKTMQNYTKTMYFNYLLILILKKDRLWLCKSGKITLKIVFFHNNMYVKTISEEAVHKFLYKM